MTEMVTSGSMSGEAETERWTTRREQQRKNLLASGAAGPHCHRAPPRLRSVHREFTGRAIELRNHFVLAEADAVIRAEGETGALQRLGAEALSESKNAACEQGIPRNLGGPAVSRSEAGGATRKKPGLVLAAPCRHESEEVGAGSTVFRRKRRDAGRAAGRRSSS